MPDAALVKVIVDAYGWPIVTVAVLLVVLWGAARLLNRVMTKHEGQMAQVVSAMTITAEVNERILTGLQAVAAQMGTHDTAESERHRQTQDKIHWWRERP